MKKWYWSCCLLAILTAVTWTAVAQEKDLRFDIGLSGGGALGLTESQDDQVQPFLRAFFSSPWVRGLQTELGAGYALNGDGDYKTQLIPVDLRLRFAPFTADRFIPYLYVGLGALHYNVTSVPPDVDQNDDYDGWTAHLPYGVGIQYRVAEYWALELSAGSNFTFSDEINPVISDDKDSFASALVGIRYTLGGRDTDPDKDSLLTKIEKQIGTNPRNPDTDTDGLSDGDEYYTYKTNPLRADTDGDGLTDSAEINTYKTDPNKADTDGDGLSDGDEVIKYKTDPLVTDTDNDGLSDGDEVISHKTDPKVADTDGEGLSDGQEVTTYKTNPLKADTDGGSVDDATEIANGTDPLNPDDDVPKKEEVAVQVGEHLTAQNMLFNFGSARILPEAIQILTQALDLLQKYPDLGVEINGYTCNIGPESFNMELSRARAEAVKKWFLEKGIAADRLTAKWHGPDNPVATNDTKEGRKQNRRVEIIRAK